MDFKKYGVVYGLIAIVGVLFIVTRLFPDARLGTLTTQRFVRSTPASEIEVSPVPGISVVIDFGDAKKTYSVSASNAYGALVEAAKQDNMDVGIKQYDFGVLVEKVGIYQNTQQRVWVYTVNGAAQSVAPDKKEIKPGTTIEWSFKKP